jgi:hypothetical protein
MDRNHAAHRIRIYELGWGCTTEGLENNKGKMNAPGNLRFRWILPDTHIFIALAKSSGA